MKKPLDNVSRFRIKIACSVVIGILAAGLSSCGGGSSSAGGNSASNNPVPAVTGLSPSAATAGSAAQTLTINGTNFVSSSTVTYNGSAHATTFVNASQLTIPLSATDQAQAGNFPVAVTNPSPGGGTSTAVSFTVNALTAPPQISSLSGTSVSPLTPLTISGTGFDTTNGAISVLLVSEAGNPSFTVPAFAITSTTVQVMVPPLPVTGTFSGDIVDLQVIQVDGGSLSTSNIITGLQVDALPAVPAGTTTGDFTLYYLKTALNVSSTLQADAVANGWTAVAADLTQYDANINALIGNVTFVRSNPSQTAAMTTSNGLTVALDQNAIALSDQLVQAYVAQVASQVPSSFARRKKQFASRPKANQQSSTACPGGTGNPAEDAFLANACTGQQYMQTYAAQEGSLLQVFGTLYYGFGVNVLGAYASVAATAAAWGPEAVLGIQLAASGIGSYAGAAGTASAPPSPCDVIAGAGTTVLDNAADTNVGIFSAILTYFQLDRDVSAITNPSAAETSCAGPLVAGPPAGAPSGTTAIDTYQTANGATTETTLAVPTVQQSEPTTVAVIPPAPVTTYTLTAGVGSGDGSVESFPEGISCGNATCTSSFPAGTSLTVTATPASGESLIAWSGACTGIGPCVLTMNSNEGVTATFGPGQTYSGNFNQLFGGTFADPAGDTYSASASGTIILNITESGNGTISGSASVPTYLGISVNSCPIGDCEPLPFSETAVGTVSGTAGSFTGTFVSSDQDFTMVFTGSLSGTSITGSATISGAFLGTAYGSSISTTLSGSVPSTTLTQQ